MQNVETSLTTIDGIAAFALRKVMVDIQKEADSVLTGEQSQPIVVADDEGVIRSDGVFRLTLSALNIDRQNPLINLGSLSEIHTVGRPQSAF